MMNCRDNRWMWVVVCGLLSGNAICSDSGQVSKSLNPYHEQKLQNDIKSCAAQVLATANPEEKCLRQQELCKKLIQAERYDEAVEVASNIYNTPNVNAERRAAHHFLMADIYSRKMQASTTLSSMDSNRNQALAVIRQIDAENYPARWEVPAHARRLEKELNDNAKYETLKRKVAARQGLVQDNGKDAVADAQSKYLNATRGRKTSYSSPSSFTQSASSVAGFENSYPSSRRSPSSQSDDMSLPSLSGGKSSSTGQASYSTNDTGFIVKNDGKIQSGRTINPNLPSNTPQKDLANLPSSPTVERTFSNIEPKTVNPEVENRRLLSRTTDSGGMLTNQPGGSTTKIGTDLRSSLMANGRNSISTQEVSTSGYIANSIKERAAASSALNGGRGNEGSSMDIGTKISLSPTYATGQAPKR